MKFFLPLLFFLSLNAFSMFEYPNIDMTNPYEVCNWYQNYLYSNAPKDMPASFEEICLKATKDVEDYLGDDFNLCAQEANKMRDKDYNRCDGRNGGDRCYDRADRNWNRNLEACEDEAKRDAIKDGVNNATKSFANAFESLNSKPSFSFGVENKTYNNYPGEPTKSQNDGHFPTSW